MAAVPNPTLHQVASKVRDMPKKIFEILSSLRIRIRNYCIGKSLKKRVVWRSPDRLFPVGSPNFAGKQTTSSAVPDFPD
jgi:hypothetical protein